MSRAVHFTPVTRAVHRVGCDKNAPHGRYTARTSPSPKVKHCVGFGWRQSRPTSLSASSDLPDDEIESMVDVDAIRQMLQDDPEVKEQERKIANEARNAASLQVDAKLQLEKTIIADELRTKSSSASEQLVSSQSKALAEFEAKSAAVLAAEAKMNAIAEERQQLEREAKDEGIDSSVKSKKWGSAVSDDIDEDAERIESAKCGGISAIAGSLLSAPLLLSQSNDNALSGLESVGGVFVSCLLFGVVLRYAQRDDLGNDQLKLGVLGAFGLTRGLGEVDVYLHGSDTSQFSTYAEAALLAGESLLPFAFAFAALDYGFKSDVLKPFPIKKK